MGEEYFTIDILLQDNSDYKEFTQEMIDTLQLKANQAVWENVHVDTKYCSTLEEAQTYNIRKPLALDEDITVVLIGSINETYDSCACCGTHVRSSGEIGLISIIKVENYKGMARFTIKAGLPAYLDVVIRNKVTSALCSRYSTEIDQLMERINVQETKNGKCRKELYDLKKRLLDEEKDELLAQIKEYKETNKSGVKHLSISINTYDRYSAEDLQTLGRSLGENLPCLMALVSQTDKTAILVSSGHPKCGSLVKEYAQLYQGKGGGNDQLARAIFQKMDNLETFLDLLEKHLR